MADFLPLSSVQGCTLSQIVGIKCLSTAWHEFCNRQTEEMLAIVLQNIFEYMLCIVVLSDSSWTIILIDIVVSDQVCVLYASSRKRAGEGEDWCQLT
jgi:hypothetical protein